MAQGSYRTVPEELVEHADRFRTHFDGLGYRVHVERAELGQPYTAVLTLKRPRTTLLFELDLRIDFRRMDDWMRYGKSCTTDTRVAVGLPAHVAVSAEDVQKLRQMGLGLYRSMPNEVFEVLPPQDLALHATLPEITQLPVQMRRLLGPAYEQFAHSDWREGFQDACQVIEVEARTYLKRGMDGPSPRLTLLRPNGSAYNPSPQQIDRMTLGQLAHAYAAISTQNSADATIAQGLVRLNDDRVGVTHHKRRATTERRLRQHVGRHMWTVVAVLKALLGVN